MGIMYASSLSVCQECSVIPATEYHILVVKGPTLNICDRSDNSSHRTDLPEWDL